MGGCCIKDDYRDKTPTTNTKMKKYHVKVFGFLFCLVIPYVWDIQFQYVWRAINKCLVSLRKGHQVFPKQLCVEIFFYDGAIAEIVVSVDLEKKFNAKRNKDIFQGSLI